jgi:hypothetical protein
VTHSPLVSKLADRTVHLENGQLIRTLATGQPRQLIATQNDQVAAANEAARRRSITVLPALSARGFLGAGRAAPHDVMPDPPETLIPVPVTLPSHAGSRLV